MTPSRRCARRLISAATTRSRRGAHSSRARCRARPAKQTSFATAAAARSSASAHGTFPSRSFSVRSRARSGDITHLSKPSEFDDADRIISQARLDVHYVPGEHDVLDEDVKLYRDRYGRGTKGAGWYSFDANGVHFIGLVNVVDLKAGGLGNLGNEQLEWLEDDLKGKSKSTPVVLFAHIPLWTVYPPGGWRTKDGAPAPAYATGSRSGHCAQLPHTHHL